MNTLLTEKNRFTTIKMDTFNSVFPSSTFENYFSDLLNQLDAPVKNLAREFLLSGGKRIRPYLLHACADSHSKYSNDLLKASAILEIVHAATLIHDDVIDSADTRRGLSTMHSVFGEHTAVLFGDSLFSFALELSSEFPTTEVCRIVSVATKKTCFGEINQNFLKGDIDLTSINYFNIIQDKTGELFRASCYLGAYLTGVPVEECNNLGNFGASLGINYQLYDDLLDIFGSQSKCEKTLGTDFKARKFTLPFIRLFELVSPDERSDLVELLDQEISNDFLENRVSDLFQKYRIFDLCSSELAKKISYSKNIARDYSNPDISERLMTFISSFEEKISMISQRKNPNFVAIAS